MSESFGQDIGQFHSPRVKPYNLESFVFVKNVFVMKSLTDFRKMVETSVDPRLTYALMTPYKSSLIWLSS